MTGGHDGAAILLAARLLPDMLATDVQHYAPFIAEITAAIAAARDGSRPGPHALHGNVYTVTLSRAGAQIANARDKGVVPETLTLDAFEAAFRHWTYARG